MNNSPVITAFFDEPTNTISYLIADPETREAAVIDPVLDFDLASGTADCRSADRIIATAEEQGWRIVMVLETHAHADHLSAAPYIKARAGAPIGIGEHIRDVQKIFRPVFALDDLPRRQRSPATLQMIGDLDVPRRSRRRCARGLSNTGASSGSTFGTVITLAAKSTVLAARSSVIRMIRPPRAAAS